METALMIALDLAAIAALALGTYYLRHRRRDLAVAFVGINVGVLAVSLVLGSSSLGLSLGLGLFGVLSIIRLRSSEISQREVAYYFSALAIGLVCGLSAPGWLPVALVALILAAMWGIDSRGVMAAGRQQLITLDQAFLDEDELRAHLEVRLRARVRALTVQQVDLVNDTTLVDVRFDRPAATARDRHEAIR